MPDGLWTLSDLIAVPTLAVLGERGAGKSDVLAMEHERLKASGANVYPVIDVASVADARGFETALDETVAWADGLQSDRERVNAIAHVLVDGLDDMIVGPDRSARVLAIGIRRLRSLPRVDVRVIVACRTPLWPAFDEQVTVQSDTTVHPVVVAPLTRDDVALAARVEGRDPEQFLAQLDARGLMPLAQYPAMLIAVLQATGSPSSVPASVVDIYERALHGQCAPDPSALRANEAAPAAVALDAASVIAGYERLSGHGGISLAQSMTTTAHNDVLSAGALIAAAPPNAGSVALSWRLVEQVAQSGVYRDDGQQTYRPTHGSYADFLAARFLHRLSGLPTARMLDLLLGPQIDGRRRVPPSLSEIAGHLASLSTPIRIALQAQDPRSLLRSDLHSWTDAGRADLVAALLAASSPVDDYTADAPLFDRVAHPGLGAQLRPVIEQRSGSPAFDLAIALAAACRPIDLAPALVDLAADDSAEPDARSRALAALSRPLALADAQRLLAIAQAQSPTTGGGDMCCWILDALWPESVLAMDLIPLLPTTGATRAQQRVLRHTVPIATRNDQLPDLLDWAAGAAASQHEEVRRCAVLVLARAASLDPIDGRLSAWLAQVARNAAFRVQEEWSPIGDVLAEAVSLRRAVVTALVAADPAHAATLLGQWPGLRDPADTLWLLDQVEAADLAERAAWIEALFAVADFSDAAVAKAVDDVATRMPGLAQRRAAAANPHQVAEGAPQNEPLATGADLSLELSEILDAHSSSPDTAWPQLLASLNSARLAPVAIPLSTAAPRGGWTVHSRMLGFIDKPVAARVIDCAVAFLTSVDSTTVFIAPLAPASPSLTPRYELSDNARAGLDAFELLAEQPADRLDEVPGERWTVWAGPLLHLTANGAEQQASYAALVVRAYEADMPSFVDVVVEQLRLQNTFHIEPEGFFVLAGCWEKGALAEQLSTRATELADEPVFTEAILRGLMTHSGSTAPYAAATHLGDVDPDGEPAPTAVACAMALLSGYEYPLAPVSPLWAALRRSPDLYRKVLESTSALGRHGWDDALATAPRADLTALYREASSLFPPASDPPASPTDWADRGHRIAQLRDRILSEIAYRADSEAVSVLHAIADVEGRPAVFTPLLRTALTAATSFWEPTSVEELAKLIQDPRRRIVRDSAGLLTLVVEALEEFQVDLQGPNALAHLLWNDAGPKSRKPKPEVSLSDLAAWFLKKHLGEHRLVINREVQVRRHTSAGLPESADIEIEAPANGPDEARALVIIEVKGGWNRDLEDSLRKQLHDRYLVAEPGAVGLYLVGFYLCAVWEGVRDNRITQHRKRPDIDAMQRVLADQAARLSRAPSVVVLDVTFPPGKTSQPTPP